jgi:hypothetical protein
MTLTRKSALWAAALASLAHAQTSNTFSIVGNRSVTSILVIADINVP